LGDGDLVGVVAVAGVEDFLRGPDRVGERATLVQRGDDRRPVGPPLRVPMDGAGGEAESAFHGPWPLTRASARRSLPPWARPADAGEIYARDRHVPVGGRHLTLDALAHDAPGGPRDQVRIDAGNRFLEHRVHVDALYHRFVDPCSGMMMSTWAPGKAGRPSFKGTSSSHFGTIAIRAVPLRIAILRSEEHTSELQSPDHLVSC